MTIVDELAREHADFLRLVDRLEASAGGDERTARRDVRNTLLILIAALDAHERIENLAFGDPRGARPIRARRVLELVDAQHREILDLRVEFLEAINSCRSLPMPRLLFLVRRLADSLRAHFQTEEEGLWPLYARSRKPVDPSLRRRLERGVLALERDVAARSAAVSEYLESGN
ncbi:MAG: hemerythrin domain-containing protein [Elusimicrobiota bacterium]